MPGCGDRETNRESCVILAIGTTTRLASTRRLA